MLNHIKSTMFDALAAVILLGTLPVLAVVFGKAQGWS